MTVEQLIAALQTMPPTAEVLHLWDGEPRTGIAQVWLARNGEVITSDNAMVAYSTENRPIGAPTAKENPYWESPCSHSEVSRDGYCWCCNEFLPQDDGPTSSSAAPLPPNVGLYFDLQRYREEKGEV